MNDQEGYVTVAPDWRGINWNKSRLRNKGIPKFVYQGVRLDSLGEMLMMHLLTGKAPFTVHVPMYFRGPDRIVPRKLPRKPVDFQLARSSCLRMGVQPGDRLNIHESVVSALKPDFAFENVRIYGRPYRMKAFFGDFAVGDVVYGMVSRMAAGYLLAQAGIPRLCNSKARNALYPGYLITPSKDGADDLGQSLPKYRQSPVWIRRTRGCDKDPRKARAPRREKRDRMDERELAKLAELDQLAPRVLPGKKIRLEADFVLGGYEYELVRPSGERVRFHCIEVKGNKPPPDSDPQMRAYKLLERVRGIKTVVITLREIREYIRQGNLPITRVR